MVCRRRQRCSQPPSTSVVERRSVSASPSYTLAVGRLETEPSQITESEIVKPHQEEWPLSGRAKQDRRPGPFQGRQKPWRDPPFDRFRKGFCNDPVST